ncbi:MAG TPA: sugar ABC transporter substrate-binding protein [Aggregatilineales bacterium]|nr:sugar ABC transporter substrate-binding protein [Aggregatilineales bacterium]
MSRSQFVIGMSNLSEAQQFCRTVRLSMMNAALNYSNLTLVVRDNAMDNDLALRNVEEFASIPVNLAVIYHIDERFNRQLNSILLRHHIPVIAIDIPIPLATYFGADNRAAGNAAGEALGQWVDKNWARQIDKVLVLTDSRLLNVVQQRLDYAIKTLGNYAGFNKQDVFYVDGETRRDVSYERTLLVLKSWEDYHRIAIVGINDDCVLGAVEAARMLGRENDVVGVGHGANLLDDAFAFSESRFIGSVAYFPESYGTQVLDLAMRILNRQRIPQVNTIAHVCITRENYRLMKTAFHAGAQTA